MIIKLCHDNVMFYFCIVFLLTPKELKKLTFFHLVNIKSLIAVFKI